MKASNIGDVFEGIPAKASQIAKQASSLADDVRSSIDSAYDSASKSVRQASRAIEHGIDDGRHRVRKNPLAAVAVVGAAGLAIGFALGLLAGSSRD